MSRNSFFEHAMLWAPPLVYMALIFHFSSEPNPLPELTRRVSDTILHTIEYGGLAVLFRRALVGEGLGWPHPHSKELRALRSSVGSRARVKAA